MRLIDADELIKWCVYCADDDIVRVNRKVMISMLEHAPTVDAEPVRHGRWEAVEYGDGTVRTECSICGYGRGLSPVRNYCPNCGAKMDEVITCLIILTLLLAKVSQ